MYRYLYGFRVFICMLLFLNIAICCSLFTLFRNFRGFLLHQLPVYPDGLFYMNINNISHFDSLQISAVATMGVCTIDFLPLYTNHLVNSSSFVFRLPYSVVHSNSCGTLVRYDSSLTLFGDFLLISYQLVLLPFLIISSMVLYANFRVFLRQHREYDMVNIFGLL